uniref:Uncharacterized protein n=2 Tax=Pavlovaceae TaxID=418969 RepID=M1JF80_DIALT|nr:hypothetical protein H907_pgp107 [Diacronema lutheri]YP_009863744.1 hypothetical protein [Pavlova sp. NIVA-4/92]AGE93723.1 hypothetical protein [Diacronema lutheri]QKE31075.1 hypothetical protein [Pavlova sp. NIVA-4/92]
MIKKAIPGKSTFFKWYYWRNPEDVAFISDAGHVGQLRKYLVNCGDCRVYLCDLPRSVNTKSKVIPQIIQTLEILKNGMMISAMYGGRGLQPKCSMPAHIFICASFIPDTKLLSPDRWYIYCVDNTDVQKPMRLMHDHKSK